MYVNSNNMPCMILYLETQKAKILSHNYNYYGYVLYLVVKTWARGHYDI